MTSAEKEKPPLLVNNYKVSFSCGSMIEILDGLEETASRPSQTSVHHIG